MRPVNQEFKGHWWLYKANWWEDFEKAWEAKDDEIQEKSTILSVSNNTLDRMPGRVSNVVWGIGQIELEFK